MKRIVFFVIAALVVASLLLMATGCTQEDETRCVEIGGEDTLIDVACVKCFPDDAGYSEWFRKCWFYVLIAAPGDDTTKMQMAADSLCACEL